MDMQEISGIIEQMRRDFEKHEDYNKSAHKDIYERLGKLESQSPVTELQFNQIMEAIKEIKEDLKAFKSDMKSEVDSIKSAPAKRWESLTATIIACLVTGIVSFVISKLIGG